MIACRDLLDESLFGVFAYNLNIFMGFMSHFKFYLTTLWWMKSNNGETGSSHEPRENMVLYTLHTKLRFVPLYVFHPTSA